MCFPFVEDLRFFFMGEFCVLWSVDVVVDRCFQW